MTILPVFSQDRHGSRIDPAKIPDLDRKTQDAGTEVVNAKNGKGSATLSMAYAGARLGRAVLAGMSGQAAVECAYIKSDVTELDYFASRIQFGRAGVTRALPIGNLSAHDTLLI